MAAHLTDWRCAQCQKWNTEAAKACGKCARVCLYRWRFTRAKLRTKAAEHRTAAILKRFGL